MYRQKPESKKLRSFGEVITKCKRLFKSREEVMAASWKLWSVLWLPTFGQVLSQKQNDEDEVMSQLSR